MSKVLKLAVNGNDCSSLASYVAVEGDLSIAVRRLYPADPNDQATEYAPSNVVAWLIEHNCPVTADDLRWALLSQNKPAIAYCLKHVIPDDDCFYAAAIVGMFSLLLPYTKYETVEDSYDNPNLIKGHLMNAVTAGRVDKVTQLCSLPNYQFASTPFTMAICTENVEMIKIMLSYSHKMKESYLVEADNAENEEVFNLIGNAYINAHPNVEQLCQDVIGLFGEENKMMKMIHTHFQPTDCQFMTN